MTPMSFPLAALLATLAMHPADNLRTDNPLFCVAANVYWEARGEPFKGQLAVANVTRNRVMDSRWPNDYCRVVRERDQFSWVAHRAELRRQPVDRQAWSQAIGAAVMVMGDHVPDMTEGATHYCNPRKTRTPWCHEGITIAQIGRHKFTLVE